MRRIVMQDALSVTERCRSFLITIFTRLFLSHPRRVRQRSTSNLVRLFRKACALGPSFLSNGVEEWATTLLPAFKKVRRFGGSGDLGIDIAGFSSDSGFKGPWTNHQCERYGHPLRPSDIWVEIGKINILLPEGRIFST